MHAEVTFNLATLYGFLLVLARVSGVVAFVPLPGLSAGAVASRVVLALTISFVLSPVWPIYEPTTLQVSRLVGWLGSEVAFGLTIGVAIAFLLEGIQMAAQMIGLQAGYSFASTIDPSTQADTTTLQLMAQLFAGSLFFTLGYDRQVVRILARSLTTTPAGTYLLTEERVQSVARLGAGIFSTGAQLAMPVLALLLLLDVSFAVLGRLQQQLQVLSLTFSIKMLTALAFLAGILRLFPEVFEKAGSTTFRTLWRVTGG